MAKFGKLYGRVWFQPRFGQMSDRSRLLYTFILSHPGSNSVGIFPFSVGFAAELLHWKPPHVERALGDLQDNRWVEYDKETNLIRICGWFNKIPGTHEGYNNIMNTSHLQGAAKALGELPRSGIFHGLINEVKSPDCCLDPRYSAPLLDLLSGRTNTTPTQVPTQVSTQVPTQVSTQVPTQVSTQVPTQVSTHIDIDIDTDADTDTDTDARLDVSSPDGLRRAFLSLCPSLPRIKDVADWNGKRMDAVGRAIVAQPDPEWWRRLFERCEASDFLTNRTGQGTFRATFDWIIEPVNLQKIAEGNYDNHTTRFPAGDTRRLREGSRWIEEFINAGK